MCCAACSLLRLPCTLIALLLLLAQLLAQRSWHPTAARSVLPVLVMPSVIHDAVCSTDSRAVPDPPFLLPPLQGKTLQGISLLWTLLSCKGHPLLGGDPLAKRVIICCPTSLVGCVSEGATASLEPALSWDAGRGLLGSMQGGAGSGWGAMAGNETIWWAGWLSVAAGQ
jgi:hypothetical protein